MKQNNSIFYPKLLGLLIVCLLCWHTYKVFLISVDPIVPPVPPPVVVPVDPVVPELTYDQIIDLIKKEDLHKYIKVLSSKEFEGRGTGTNGDKLSTEFITNYLKSINVSYQIQNFTVRGRETNNIIGKITPSKNPNNKIIVIGAHYDHLGKRGSVYYPGADDNASGVAGVMCIARAVKKYENRLKHTILFHFYGAEELGLLGSKYYVQNPIFPLEDHVAMINLDMIGYLKKYREEYNTTTYRDEHIDVFFDYTISLKNIVNALSSKYIFANNISGYKPGGSDHAPFYHKGIPVVFLHTGSHAHYHKPTDTEEKLNYEGLEACTKLALEILLTVDKKN